MDYIQIDARDNVAVALCPLAKGSAAAGVVLRQDIPQAHKLALRPVAAGEAVIKYGYPIGIATADIAAGEHVHTHNLRTALSGAQAYRYEPKLTHPAPWDGGSFNGYLREDGQAGVRNELWIIPTVGCMNAMAQNIAAKGAALAVGGIDGVYAFPHPYGCCQMGDDLENTHKALCALARNPNAAGVLVLGLGCEGNTMDWMKRSLAGVDGRRIRFLVAQEVEDEVQQGLRLLEELAAYARSFARQPLPMSKLVVGLKCGGSDGLSGITANLLVGAFSDLLIAAGGSTILTEVPEMFGAETILMERCRTKEVFEKTVAMVNGFKEYYIAHGQPVYENPSPGNKEGGISTLEDKSLGCTRKGGMADVVDVLAYGEPLSRPGLNLLDAPGNDMVASTATAMAGAQLLLFTTGRGTPFGCPVPTVKIATNSALARKKRIWIDYDAGHVAEGGLAGAALDFYEYIRRLASGEERCRNEENGFRDIAIFKNGVTL